MILGRYKALRESNCTANDVKLGGEATFMHRKPTDARK